MTTTLIVPGLNSSGSAHWQTWLESELSDVVRVIQADWKRADLAQWASRVRRAITRHEGPLLIAAHSFGALAAVQAAEDLSHRIAGALLVAPADPDKFAIGDLLPAARLSFPAVVVASTNDPWLGFDRAVGLAHLWGAGLIALGDAGHINAESGYGPWPQGLALLRQLENAYAARREDYPESAKVIRPRDRRPDPRGRERAPRAGADARSVEHYGEHVWLSGKARSAAATT